MKVIQGRFDDYIRIWKT